MQTPNEQMDEIDSIEKDLGDSFEQFRRAEGYMSATRAASDGAAQLFVRRFLAWHKQESKRLMLEGAIRELKFLLSHDDCEITVDYRLVEQRLAVLNGQIEGLEGKR